MKLTILGSTGSVGKSTLDVVSQHPHRYQVTALAACSNWQELFHQCKQFLPKYAVLIQPQAAEILENRIRTEGLETEVLCGTDGLQQIVALKEIDAVMAAITGAAGLVSSFAALQQGKRLLLANKESLVMAGNLFIKEAQKNQAQIIPVDSEHNAIFQCIPTFSPGTPHGCVSSITLTASGGPFLNTPLDELNTVTPEHACTHPKWSMGKKISVDSATMMNKGLEVIEAHFLFALPFSHIQVVIHPQSIVHSLVHFSDGSVLAQLGLPDMRIPISYALSWPERLTSSTPTLDLASVAKLEFLAVDLKRFPTLSLAVDAGKQGGCAPTYLNAANEIAVEAFLEGKLLFSEIPKVVEETLAKLASKTATTLSDILSADHLARVTAREMMEQRDGRKRT